MLSRGRRESGGLPQRAIASNQFSFRWNDVAERVSSCRGVHGSRRPDRAPCACPRDPPVFRRYADPRGGGRHVIPEKGNYLVGPAASARLSLTTGPDRPLWPRLADRLPGASDLPPFNGTTSRERIWVWSKPKEATNATRKGGTG